MTYDPNDDFTIALTSDSVVEGTAFVVIEPDRVAGSNGIFFSSWSDDETETGYGWASEEQAIALRDALLARYPYYPYYFPQRWVTGIDAGQVFAETTGEPDPTAEVERGTVLYVTGDSDEWDHSFPPGEEVIVVMDDYDVDGSYLVRGEDGHQEDYVGANDLTITDPYPPVLRAMLAYITAARRDSSAAYSR